MMSIYSAHVEDAAQLLFLHLCIPLLRMNSTFYWIVPPVRVVVAALFIGYANFARYVFQEDTSVDWMGNWWKLLEDIWRPVSIPSIGGTWKDVSWSDLAWEPASNLHWKMMKVDVDHSFTLIFLNCNSHHFFKCPLHPIASNIIQQLNTQPARTSDTSAPAQTSHSKNRLFGCTLRSRRSRWHWWGLSTTNIHWYFGFAILLFRSFRFLSQAFCTVFCRALSRRMHTKLDAEEPVHVRCPGYSCLIELIEVVAPQHDEMKGKSAWPAAESNPKWESTWSPSLALQTKTRRNPFLKKKHAHLAAVSSCAVQI